MRLALVNPPHTRLVEPLAYPPVNLGYLAAYVRRYAPWAQCDLLNLAGHAPTDVLRELAGYDVVGWTAMSPYYHDVVRHARAARDLRGWQRQIIGGPHVTLAGVGDPVFDAIFMGDGEASLVTYLERLRARGPVRRVYYGRRVPLDDLPFPEYEPAVGRLNFAGNNLSAVVFGSRGCPYHCAYCATHDLNGRVRWRSVASVVAELRMLMARGVGDVRFEDDCFLARRQWALDLCRAMDGMGLTWGCLVRVSHASAKLFAAMKRAGCTDVSVGVESFDQDVLDRLRKGTTVPQSEDCLRMLADAGLKARVFMMISTPGETYEKTVELNSRGLGRLPHYRVILSTFMPYPGCDVHRAPERFGVRVVEPDCSRYHFHLWQRIGGEVRLAPAWSPIRIDGMTEHQQLENIRAMRRYVLHSSKADIRVPEGE